MELEHLTLNNFLSHRDTKLSLDNRGLVLIAGRVAGSAMSNSNGAGKTALLDAIAYALQGATLSGARGRDVVNWDVGRDCLVALSGRTQEGVSFRIERPQSHRELKKPQIRLGGQTYVGSEVVERIITNDILGGISFDSLVSAIIFGQGGAKAFTQLDETGRKRVLTEILGLTKLDGFLEETKTRFEEATVNAGAFAVTIRSFEDRIRDLEANIIGLRQRSANFQATQEKQIRDLETLRKNGIARLRALEQDQEAQHQTILSIRRRLQESEAIRKNFESRRNELEDGKISVTAKLVRADQALRDLSLQVKGIGDLQNKSCPTCYSTVTPQHYLEVIAKVSPVLEHAREERERLSISLNAINQNLDAARAHIQAGLKNEQEYDAALIVEQNKLFQLHSDSNQVHSDILRLSEGLEKLRNEENTAALLLLEAEAKLDNLRDELEDAQRRLGEAKRCQQNLDFWIQGFGNAGMKSLLLDGVIPKLNASAEKYSELFTEGELSVTFDTQIELKSGERREKFDVAVKFRNGKGSYRAASAGQKRRADIIAMLALGDLAASRVGQRINLAIFDEVFDNLDETGIDKMMKLLMNLQAERGTVLVVSHHGMMIPYFPNIITVDQHDGTSRLA